MYRLHGAIHAYGGTTVSARDTADSVITALTPAAWYRNATGVTSAGGFASQWDDYSGNARHLVQATGTNQPAYAAGVFTFDGADNYLKTSAFTLNQPETVYLVFKQVTWSIDDRVFDGNAANSGIVYQRTTTPTLTSYAGSNGPGTNDVAVDTYVVLTTVFNGASSEMQVNLGAATTGNPGAGNMGGFTFGASASPGSYSNIAVKEAIIFAAAHDDATRDSVITALNNALTVF